MSDNSSNRNQGITVLLILCAFLIITNTLSGYICYINFMENKNWKTRWDNDTSLLGNELREATKRLAAECYEKVRAQNTVSILEAELKKCELKISELEQRVK